MQNVFQSAFALHISVPFHFFGIEVQRCLKASTKPMLVLSQAAALASLPSSLSFLRRNPRIRFSNSLLSSLASTSSVDQSPPVRSKYGGIQLEETVQAGSQKSRLDAWIASRMHDVSRARIQSSIRSGLVTVNGRAVDKVQSSFIFC
jgi:S4 domain